MNKRLYRDEQHKTIGGVCAGLAEYLNTDVSIIRVLFLLSAVLGHGAGFLLYIVMWIVLPKRPFGINAIPGVDYMAHPEGTAGYTPDYGRKPSTARYIGGLALILIGVMFLLDQFNIIYHIDFDYFWPILLIVAGLVFIFNSRHHAPVKNTPFDDNSTQL
jgi:phage shock protein C